MVDAKWISNTENRIGHFAPCSSHISIHTVERRAPPPIHTPHHPLRHRKKDWEREVNKLRHTSNVVGAQTWHYAAAQMAALTHTEIASHTKAAQAHGMVQLQSIAMYNPMYCCCCSPYVHGTTKNTVYAEALNSDIDTTSPRHPLRAQQSSSPQTQRHSRNVSKVGHDVHSPHPRHLCQSRDGIC